MRMEHRPLSVKTMRNKKQCHRHIPSGQMHEISILSHTPDVSILNASKNATFTIKPTLDL